MEDLERKLLDHAAASPRAKPPLRPDPAPRARRYTLVSVDDHFLEPPDLFTGRLSHRFADTAPRVVRDDEGSDSWVFDHARIPLLGGDAFQSWELGQGYPGPVNYDEIRPGAWQLGQRLADMDRDGVRASLNFPSSIFGFAGQRFARMTDKQLGLAALRAYNDWVLDDWCHAAPGRMIPCQVTWLLDPLVAAAEIEHNATRGFRAVAFTENPEKLGLPSLYSSEWDPLFRACEETGTVINLHVGSSSETLCPSSASPMEVIAALFPVNGMAAAADWLFAGIPRRFPGLQIAFSEGGVGWVPMLMDRLEYTARYLGTASTGGLSPTEVMARNYWFTTFSDPTTLALRDRIGVERIMIETDYPHGDSTWPDSQALLGDQLAGCSDWETERITHANAVTLYRFPLAEGAGQPTGV